MTGNPAISVFALEAPLQLPKVHLSLLATLVLLPSALPAATVSFSHKTVTFPDGDFPYVTATADFNNDGREDLVSNIFALQTSGVGVFHVRLSTGDGTYAAPKQYTLPNGAIFSNMTV
jgi:hypothetical protein